jgi:NAD+ kinase
MKIAVFGQIYKTESLPYLVDLLKLLTLKNIETTVFKEVDNEINSAFDSTFNTYNSFDDLPKDTDLMISVGGDGTMLQAVKIIGNSGIPVIGINTGRLGFLATVQKDTIELAVEQLINGTYTINKRSLLQVSTKENSAPYFALNEISVSRKNTTTMITIDTFLDEEYLNTYWADGLIVSTPTGSTGYSLSCNGPIITPNVNALSITPIAPHNLSIRPLIIRDDTKIKLQVSSREAHFLLAMDSQVESISTNTSVYIQKADFQLQMIELKDQSFLKTLREKLLWGKDTRN